MEKTKNGILLTKKEAIKNAKLFNQKLSVSDIDKIYASVDAVLSNQKGINSI